MYKRIRAAHTAGAVPTANADGGLAKLLELLTGSELDTVFYDCVVSKAAGEISLRHRL